MSVVFEDDLRFAPLADEPQLLPNERAACQRCGLVRAVNSMRETPPLCESCKYLTASEAPPLVPDEPTPCYGSRDFALLEGEIEEALLDENVRSIHARRKEVIEIFEAEVQEQFCGRCPIADACLRWGREAEYTGFAGGHWLKDGGTIDEAVCPSGHSRRKNGFRDKDGHLRCRRCKQRRQRESRARKRQEAA